MRKMIFIAGAVALGLTVAACGSAPQQPQQAVAFESDDEDCDLDDMVERDTDCGFSKKKKPKATTAAYAKPKTSATRRSSSYSSSRSSRSSSRSSSRRR